MECERIDELTPLYLTGELYHPSQCELEDHLSRCAECASAIEEMRQIDAAILRVVTEGDCDAARIIARVRTKTAPARGAKRGFRLTLFGYALLMLCIMVVALQRKPYAAAATILSDAADDHNAEVTKHAHLEWIYDQQQIQTLVASWTGDAQLAQKLAPTGFDLDRARICELLTRNYLHLVYSRGGREVSVFVRHRDGEILQGSLLRLEQGNSLRTGRFGGASVAGFQTVTVTVIFVADVSMEQLRALVSTPANALGGNVVAPIRRPGAEAALPSPRESSNQLEPSGLRIEAWGAAPYGS